MRIAQVLTASTGGIGRHVASLVPRLVQRGHQVQIFCPSVTATAQGFGDLGFGGLGVPVRSLRQLAAARGADVVHGHGYKAGGLVALLTPMLPSPRVVTWHNAVLGRGRSAAAARVLQRVVARNADLTLGASSDLVAEALRLGAPAARLGPVAAPMLAPPKTPADQVRAELGIAEDDIFIVTVSRLAPQKNLGLVLDIAAAMRDRTRLQFVVVGEGPERASLAARIAVNALPVRLIGRRDDIADLLAAADFALLTSTWEARALVAQEALLAGLPLVATRVGGIEELVGEAAVLVDLDDPGAAAAAVAALAADPVRRAELRVAGLARAGSWPDEDAVADDVLAAYAQVIAHGGGGSVGG